MKFIKTTFLLIFIISLIYGGKYGGEFLELGVSAKNLAMGNSCSALDQSNTAFYSNPSGLAYVKQKNLGLMYMDQFGLAKYNYLGYSFPLDKRSVFAINWIHFGVTDIPRRPDLFLSGEYTSEERRAEIISKKGKGYGSFSNTEDALFFSFAKMNHYDFFLSWMFNNLRIQIPIGANIKLIRKHLDKAQAFGIGADLGARIRFHFGEIASNNLGHVSFGVTFQDFTGTNIYWDTKHLDKIKSNVKLSASFEQPIQLFESHLSFSYEYNTKYNDDKRYGVEYTLKHTLALRAGYNFNGLNYGCGLYFKFFHINTNIDYALLNHSFGNCHRIGVSLWF